MYALDAATGERIWRYNAGSGIYGGAAVTGDAVFVADLGGSVHSVSRANGRRLWKVDDLGKGWKSVSTDGRRVFSAHQDGVVNALDVADGSIVWRFESGDEIHGGAAAANGLVYFASYDDFVYALDAETGEIAWSTELRWGSQSTPTLAGSLVLVGSWDDHVYALDSRTGRLVWNFWAGDNVTASIAASEDAAYFGSDDGYFYSVSLADGSLNWRYEVGEIFRSTAAVAEGIVYIGSHSDELLALDASNGELVWKYETGDDIRSGVAVHQNTVYFGSNDDAIYALVAGFPEGYEPVATERPKPPSFQTLPKNVLRGRMSELFSWRDRSMFSEVAVFGPDGVREINGPDLALEIFENGYYMLMSRTTHQEGWQARFLPLEDYEALADERDDPELKVARGWCCTRGDDGLDFFVRGDITLNESVAVTAHEAGHAIQRMLNPVQNKAPRDSLLGALREAEAYTFQVAIIRKMGEYMDADTARWSNKYNYDAYLNRWRDRFQNSVADLTEEHDRGRLIMWQAVLNDPELVHLYIELLLYGHVSADSLMDMYYKFVRLTPGEVEPYIESIASEDLREDLNRIFVAIHKRIDRPVVEFEELVLNVPTLVIAP